MTVGNRRLLEANAIASAKRLQPQSPRTDGSTFVASRVEPRRRRIQSQEAAHESQALHAVPVHGAGPERPL